MVNTSGDERISGAIDALNVVSEASPTFWNTLYDVGDKPVFVNVAPGSILPTGAGLIAKRRQISLSDDDLHDRDLMMSSIVYELGNLKRTPDYGAAYNLAREGKIPSASEFGVEMEWIEYGVELETARTFMEARNTLLAHGYGQDPTKWCSEVSAHGEVRPAFASFDQCLEVQQASGHTAFYEDKYHIFMNETARTDLVDEAERTR